MCIVVLSAASAYCTCHMCCLYVLGAQLVLFMCWLWALGATPGAREEWPSYGVTGLRGMYAL